MISTHHGDESVQKPAVPEKVRPGPLGSHHARVVLGVLRGDLGGGEVGPVVLGNMVPLCSGSMGRRVEACGLLENDGLFRRGAGEADSDAVLGERDADTAPEGSLEGKEETGDYGTGCHCWRCLFWRKREAYVDPGSPPRATVSRPRLVG